ncbi:MAG: cyclic nucleotide-binding domain-containing protein [Spirochaetaceae bacterium]|jgi:anti-sigma regulatory factor (Ser/Thr protein kinase)|nr:cyclic nucleotide-binding domain-containing protein [Spirochaetaceae bacterium]
MTAVINSDRNLEKSILKALSEAGVTSGEVKFLSSPDVITDFVKFYFPEIIIVNLSDPVLNIDDVITIINLDRRFLNFGVVGIFTPAGGAEEEFLSKYRTGNIITFLEDYRISNSLAHIVKIIRQNYQLIFQSDFATDIKDGASGSLLIDNNISSVSSYAGIIATMLVRRGIIFPDDKIHLHIAIEELIVNAIEHGNCGITYEDKTKGLEEGKSVVDLIEERNADPEIAARKVEVVWNIDETEAIISIIDQGEGFDVPAHLEKLRSQDKMSTHGRGIRIASSVAREVKYNAKGNRVSLYLNNKNAEHDIPPGLRSGEPVLVKSGDVIIREGEESGCLFYITSGRYGVYVKGKRIDTITPNEIFLGEMAFILNQPRNATIVAEGTGRLVRIDQKTFMEIVREHPHYIMFLSRLIARRLLRRSERHGIAGSAAVADVGIGGGL